jgi:hypothetical protein
LTIGLKVNDVIKVLGLANGAIDSIITVGMTLIVSVITKRQLFKGTNGWFGCPISTADMILV